MSRFKLTQFHNERSFKMKHAKYIILAAFALFVLASAVVVSAQGPMPPPGTPPAGTPPRGQPGQGQPPQGQPPQGQPSDWTGVVQTVSSTSLTVLRSNNETFTAVISSTTKIELMVTQSTGTVSDIQVGNNVMIEGRKNTDGSVAAARIMVEPSGTKAAGAVSAVSGTTITVMTQKETITVVTTTSTKFLKGKGTGSLSDVTKGTFVMAFGTKQTDGSISATFVFVNVGPGPQGQGAPPPGQPTPVQTTQRLQAQVQPTQRPAVQMQTPQRVQVQVQPTQAQSMSGALQVQSPSPQPTQGARPTPTPEKVALSAQESESEQNPLVQLVQWILGLFK